MNEPINIRLLKALDVVIDFATLGEYRVVSPPIPSPASSGGPWTPASRRPGAQAARRMRCGRVRAASGDLARV